MAGESKQPFIGRHIINCKLTGPGSEKDTRHHEISIDGREATYLPVDALGILAQKDPALVNRILARIGATGHELVVARDNVVMPIRGALTDIFNLTTPSRRLFELMAARGASDLVPLLDKANAEALKRYLNGW